MKNENWKLNAQSTKLTSGKNLSVKDQDSQSEEIVPERKIHDTDDLFGPSFKTSVPVKASSKTPSSLFDDEDDIFAQFSAKPATPKRAAPVRNSPPPHAFC
jgi:hypothetical protein